jgi:prolyl-tRNA synthetase
VPHRVTIGDKGLKDGVVEYQNRRDAESTKVAVADVFTHVKAKLGL